MIGRSSVARALVSLLFPARCVGCGARGAWLCVRCEGEAPRLPAEHCPRCAEPAAAGRACPRCRSEPPEFDSIACPFLFRGTVREAIHQLKYRRARHLAPPLVDAALRALPPNVVSRFADLVIAPVPLSAERLALRGYNQSELLARELSEHLNLPLAARAVRRLRDTPSQMQLPAAARRANVRGAFVGDPAEVHNRTILIVDDVATTTSTLGEVSRALREAGAASVTAFVIARAE